MNGEDVPLLHPFLAVAALRSGLSFSIPLMLILFAHEMGHYLTSRYHNVDVSLPYFIPAPPLVFIIGTFGAFIRMREPARTRRVMFDIGAAGPWAGVMLAIPAVIIGLYLSDVTPLDKSAGGLELGNSLLFLGLSHLVLRRRSFDRQRQSQSDCVRRMARPVRHDAQPAAGRTARRRPRDLRAVPAPPSHDFGAVRHLVRVDGAGAARARENFWGGWMLWAVLSIALGLGHPSTVDRDTPLNPRRALAAWATVALFIVTFSPVPLVLRAPEAPPPTTPERVTARK